MSDSFCGTTPDVTVAHGRRPASSHHDIPDRLHVGHGGRLSSTSDRSHSPNVTVPCRRSPPEAHSAPVHVHDGVREPRDATGLSHMPGFTVWAGDCRKRSAAPNRQMPYPACRIAKRCPRPRFSPGRRRRTAGRADQNSYVRRRLAAAVVLTDVRFSTPQKRTCSRALLFAPMAHIRPVRAGHRDPGPGGQERRRA